MKTVIIYDSVFGNTEKIAKAIHDGFSNKEEAFVCTPDNFDKALLKDLDYLIVGSPTRGFRPTKPITDLINSFNKQELKNIRISAFDTRIKTDDVKSKPLRLIMKMAGYADSYIVKLLVKKGGINTIPPVGFYVKDKQGPLYENEIERAAKWSENFTQ